MPVQPIVLIDGVKVRKLIKGRNLTSRAFADKIGVHYGTLSNLRTDPIASDKLAEKIAGGLGVDPSEITLSEPAEAAGEVAGIALPKGVAA